MRYLTIPALLCFVSSIHAGVGDPTIRTDHPHYAGEGAFQTVEDCVRFATAGKNSPQDRAIAQYLWLLTHQYHLMSPQESYVPGRTPNTRVDSSGDLVVRDTNRSRFSYGFGLCGTVHGWNEPYWQSLGMRARRRAFPGHTNSEIEYEGGWHAFDTDMAGLIFRDDGRVAGYADVIHDPKIVKQRDNGLPCYPFAWPADFNGMKRGWEQVARGGNWYKMYNGGHATHPGIVQLRSGEKFTRWYDRDHYGGPKKRRFWFNGKGGPFRNWTFVNRGTPKHVDGEANARGNASYCNGEFDYQPDLLSETYREGVVSASVNLETREASPRLHAIDGQAAEVVFAHFSPYVICGDPKDDADPMTKSATGGLIISGKTVGEVAIAVSADEGQTWSSAKNVAQQFEVDLTDLVKGHYGWRVRFQWKGRGGLDDLRFVTVTQVSQMIYPRLKPNGSKVNYRAASRGVVAVLPNFGLPASKTQEFEEISQRSKNMRYNGRGPNSRFSYEMTDNKAGQIVFRVSAPEVLQEVRAAVRFQIRVPPPRNCDFHLDISTDGGMTWKRFAKADVPADNEHSSGWVSGKINVAAARSKTAFVRVNLYQGGYRTALIDCCCYGVYQTPSPQRVTLTYGWKENGSTRTHVERIPANRKQHSFNIRTGPSIVDEFVRLSCP